MPRTHYTLNKPSAHYNSGLLQKIRNTTRGLNCVAPSLTNRVHVAGSSPQYSGLKSTRASKKTKPFSPVLAAIAEDRPVAPSSPTATNSPSTSPSSRLSAAREYLIDAVEKIYLSALLACDFLRQHDHKHYLKYKELIEPYLITELTFSRKISEMMTKLADKHNNCFSCCLSFFKSTQQSKTLSDQIINAFLKIDYLISEDAEKFGIAIAAVIKTIEPTFNLDECLLEKKELMNTEFTEKSASSY